MSITFSGKALGTRKVKLSSTSATTLVSSQTYRQTVASINAAEISGNTPTFTLEIYDGSTSTYICKGLQLSANRVRIFDQGWLLEPGESMRVTASSANQIDVIATIEETTLAH